VGKAAGSQYKENLNLYIHSPVHFHGVVLEYLSTGATFYSSSILVLCPLFLQIFFVLRRFLLVQYRHLRHKPLSRTAVLPVSAYFLRAEPGKGWESFQNAEIALPARRSRPACGSRCLLAPRGLQTAGNFNRYLNPPSIYTDEYFGILLLLLLLVLFLAG
jgi:hypothetical protein